MREFREFRESLIYKELALKKKLGIEPKGKNSEIRYKYHNNIGKLYERSYELTLQIIIIYKNSYLL
jgi:hypothetical protein